MTEPIEPFAYSTNEYGATIEHGVFAPVSLDEGRCCGRKPLVYKTGGLRLFCHRCSREYNPDGTQRQNWAYKLRSDGNFSRDWAVST